MSSSEIHEQAEALRRFNRFYTRRIGVLEEGLLKTRFPMTQARVLFELGTRHAATAGEIGDTLGLDAGYLSRILQEFSAQGLITRKKSDQDQRRTFLSLTAKGRRAFGSLDRKSRAEMSRLLQHLPEPSRTELLASLRDAQRILSHPTGRSMERVVIRTHRIGDIGWAIERHATLYAEEFQWNDDFEVLVATLFARFGREHDPKLERFWVAELDGERMGCVFVVRNEEDATVAQLRCLLVDPRARGLGIGRRLVGECIDFATSVGYRRMILWTNDVLVAARRIYEAAGFCLVKEDHHHSFGHDLVGQVWELDLAPQATRRERRPSSNTTAPKTP